jgi:repressor LexA
MLAPTRRQREILDFIAHYIDSHGARPSYQLIARHMGVRSKAGIARIVGDLEAQGFLERRRVNGHFTISLATETAAETTAHVNWLDTPDMGEFREDFESIPFPLPSFALRAFLPEDIRAFRVRDEALRSDGITMFDIALLELRSFARDGDIVAAVVKKERTVLRKYFRAGAYVELCTSDDDGEIIRIAADKVEVRGIYRGLLRPIM